MAVYNSKNHLAEAIESILNQSFRKFELIIINDGSSDNCLDIIQNYSKQDQRIVLISNKINRGPAKARNQALNIARGSYIAVLDSDDIALSNRLEIQHKYMSQHNNIFLTGSNYQVIDKSGVVSHSHSMTANPKKIQKKLPYKNCFCHSTVMYRNANKNKILYRNKFEYSQDYDLYLRLLSDGKQMTNLKHVLAQYRINPNGISLRERGKQKLFAQKAKQFYRERVEYGEDSYDEFDPNDILGLDTKKSFQKIILEEEITSSFKLGEYKALRKIYKTYSKLHGFKPKLFIYYWSTFIPKPLINMFKKFLSNLKGIR